jgi:hypothetical protein
MSTPPEIYELFRLEQLAYDVAFNTGQAGSSQGIDRALRLLNRAGLIIAGHDRRWSWLHVKDSFNTVANQEEYSLNQDVRELTGVWLEGSYRQKLDRIPTTQFNELEPQSSSATGTPRLYDRKGVDSSGCMVISLYPLPTSAIEVFYRYYKHLLPIKNQQADVVSAWGLPPNMVPVLVEVATALSYQGLNDTRFNDQFSLAIGSIDNAYAADQSRPDTVYRAKDQAAMLDMYSEGRLPAEFGY